MKFLGLIKNELIKQWNKLSVKIIIGLLLISTIGLPLLYNYSNNHNSNDWALENYKMDINNYKSIINTLGDTKNAELEKIYYQWCIDKLQFQLDNKITWNDWRYELTESTYTKQLTATALQKLLDKFTIKDITNTFMYIDESILAKYENLSEDEIRKEIDTLNTQFNDSKNIILSKDHKKYTENEVTTAKKTIEETKKNIATLEEELKKSPNDKTIIKNLNLTKENLKLYEELLSVSEYRLDNNISYEENDWKHRTLESLFENINNKYTPILNEEEFKNNFSYKIQHGYTYEDYEKDYKNNKQKNIDSISTNWYSLRNNIPSVDYNIDARNSVDNIYVIYINIIAIIAVIIASGIVSSEFSKGTIRLLMIRPVSRWKILLSKLLSVMVISIVLLISSITLVTIVSGFIYGFDGLTTPVLAIKNGIISEQNYFVSIIPKLAFSSISILFVISFAFVLSTVFKNTALAVALPVAAFSGCSIVTMVMANFNQTWIAKTFIPYINLSSFLSEGGFMSMLKEEFNLALDPHMGSIQLIILSIIFIALSFITFIKKDVTN